LQGRTLQETLLEGMQLAPLGDAFDRGNLFAIHLQAQDQATVNRLSVQQHGTGATIAVITAFFTPGESDFISQRFQ
jgi:hypothetical protein